MEIFKIVFFILAVVSSVYLRSSHEDERMFSLPIMEKSNKDPFSVYDTCICYPNYDNVPTVPELLDPQSLGMERLVLYIYKDFTTNKIKIFTPKMEQQRLLPDLPYEVGGDLVNLDLEPVVKVFDKNPHKIVINNPYPLIIDTKVNKPIDFNGVDVIEVNENIPIIPIASTPIDININSNPNNGVEFDNIYNIWPGNPEETNNHVTPGHDSEEKEYGYMHRPGNKMQWVINSNIPDQIYKFEFYDQKGTKNNNGEEVYAPDLNINGVDKQVYLTFDEWFTRQMMRFQDVNLPGNINSINTAVLRSLVQNVLRENNMYVSTEGVITDPYGGAIDVNNLKLRPMLFGNPVKYPYGPYQGSENLKLPTHLPYLEGILVTLVYPPKVLGIIPLGKTYLSQVSPIKQQKGTSVWNMVSNLLPDVKPSAKETKLTIPKTLSNVNQPTKEVKGIFEVENPKWPIIEETPHVTVKDKMKKSKGKLKEKLTVKKDNDVTKHNKLLGTKNFPAVGGILDQMIGLLKKVGKEDEEYGWTDEELYVENKPDYRIIGGNAATSSGAPLSNKGRSGDIY